MIRAVKCVTNVLANEGKAGALSLILSPKGGQVRAIKSTALGNLANAGVIEGNVLFGLITQRSKVQIFPRNQLIPLQLFTPFLAIHALTTWALARN
jgi:hypothetical protein